MSGLKGCAVPALVSSPVDEPLLEAVLAYAEDPAGFVSFLFPWGEPGTVLEHEDGPDTWQIEVMDYLAARLVSSPDPIRVAVASGHGPGKSTLMAWLILWMLSTKPHPQIPITASTAKQLETKTWRELAKWHGLALNRDWFTWTATKLYHTQYPETWYASAIPWSKDKAQSFAGTHEEHVLVGYDEASTIDDAIWEVTDGVMSTPGAIWLAFGNPEQPTGRFRDCFGRHRTLWKTWQIDSRSAKKTNKAEIQRQMEVYGEDSDFVRVRWLGKFPRQGPTQFISEALVEAAQERQPHDYQYAPKILGVDVARFGDNETVLVTRQGTAILAVEAHRGLSLDQTALRIVTCLEADKDLVQVFVDVVGLGAGVVDMLHHLGYRERVMGINGGSAGTELLPQSSTPKYFNLRAQMWGHIKDWLEQGGCLPQSPPQLAADLVVPQYAYAREQQLQLERKEEIRARGEASPDYGDALGFTFARPVAPRRRRPVAPPRLGHNWRTSFTG